MYSTSRLGQDILSGRKLENRDKTSTRQSARASTCPGAFPFHNEARLLCPLPSLPMASATLLQDLLADETSSHPSRSLSLTILTWSGRCTSFDADGFDPSTDDTLVGTYTQQGRAQALRPTAWSDEHGAVVYEPVEEIKFEYTRVDEVGASGSSVTYTGGWAGEPDEHGPVFALCEAGESPYAKVRPFLPLPLSKS